MNSLTDRRRVLLSKQGKSLFLNEKTGQYYPKHLDVTLSDVPNNVIAYRWIYCDKLESAIVRGTNKVGYSMNGEKAFSGCPKLRTLVLPSGCGGTTIIASGCNLLSEVVLGSIGHPVSGLYSMAFTQSGTSAADKSITIYVDDSASLPLAYAPWGLTGAEVIYRSATTGEIMEVPNV